MFPPNVSITSQKAPPPPHPLIKAGQKTLINESQNRAKHDFIKVLYKAFFKKLAGCGAEPAVLIINNHYGSLTVTCVRPLSIRNSCS